MFLVSKSKLVIVISISVIILLWKLFALTKITIYSFNNVNVTKVPNIVHYVMFNRNTIDFITYLSILSVLKVQKPFKILIHTNSDKFYGSYWNKLFKSNSTIHVMDLQMPTHTYGQLLSSVYHASDVARIHVLKTFGGIYLDTDVLVLNKLDSLRKYEMVVGWPENKAIGNQVLLANANAKFLTLWQDGYKHYRSRDWYYNAGRYPTEILIKHPHLAHYERTLLGVQYLLDKLHSANRWDDWKQFYTIHLLSRHHDVTKTGNETVFKHLNSNFGNIVRYILSM